MGTERFKRWCSQLEVWSHSNITPENLGWRDDTKIAKTVKNYDWESLAADNNFIYVGDFGNNFSNRDNLTILKININEKFIGERGRINCSLRDSSGFWRWLGIQFVISGK